MVGRASFRRFPRRERRRPEPSPNVLFRNNETSFVETQVINSNPVALIQRGTCIMSHFYLPWDFRVFCRDPPLSSQGQGRVRKFWISSWPVVSAEIGFVPPEKNYVLNSRFATHGLGDAIASDAKSAFVAAEFEELVNRNFI